MGKAKRGPPSHSRAGDRRDLAQADPCNADGLVRYALVGEIGVGGMARVHLAYLDGPGGFRKWVAIKRIHRHLASDDTFVRMFLDEARVAARISHPHVAQVFELGRHRHTYWLAMEYLHGEPLHELICASAERGRKALDPYLSARLIAEAAEGLHAAHELRDHDGSLLNLVHRDVSPHNIFVTYDGSAKMVDFGIATGAGRLACTRVGTLKGKLAYMSPEQIRGRPLDRRADVFALGIVLWELTTGERLFRGETELETLERVQACRVPRPTKRFPGFPPELEAILLAALQKDRGLRLRSARELSRALRRFGARADGPVDCEEVSAHVREVLAHRLRAREALLKSAPAPATQPPSRTVRGVSRAISSTKAEHRSYPARVPRLPPACTPAVANPTSTLGSASWLVPIRAPEHGVPRGHSETVRAGEPPSGIGAPRRELPVPRTVPVHRAQRGTGAPIVGLVDRSDDDDAVTRIMLRNGPSLRPARSASTNPVRCDSPEAPRRPTFAVGLPPRALPADRSGRQRSRAGTKGRAAASVAPPKRSRGAPRPRVSLRMLAAATTALAVAWIVLLAV
jgi:serine/threonine protein kinase